MVTYQGNPVIIGNRYPAVRVKVIRKGQPRTETRGPFFDVFTPGRKPLLVARSLYANELKGL